MANLKNKYLLSATLLLFLAGLIQLSSSKPKIVIDQQQAALNIKNSSLNLFHLGLKRMLSSVLWTKTLLDSDEAHYKNDDLNSWMYLRFNTMINLDPKFYEVYYFGGIYLSVIKDDDLGAKNIYDKGLTFYPEDIKLRFNAGFHYYYELKQTSQALEILKPLIDEPNLPFYARSLISSLASKEQNTKLALYVLRRTLKTLKPGLLRDRVLQKIEEIKKRESLSSPPMNKK
jgi:lipoprotein NlpI